MPPLDAESRHVQAAHNTAQSSPKIIETSKRIGGKHRADVGVVEEYGSNKAIVAD